MTERSDAAHPGWWRRNAVLLVGAALVVVGAVTTVLGSGLAPIAIGSIGAFRYAPLAEMLLVPARPLWQEPLVLGLLTLVCGLLVIAANLGFRAGRERGRAPQA